MSKVSNPVLHFVSWNTNGLKSKMLNVEKKLSNINADVAFIQETHVGLKCWSELKYVKGWKIYFTVHNCRSKGVAILIKDKESFAYLCHDEDPCGGYIVLFCHLYGELYTLVNVYNHKFDREILTKLKDYLKETAEGVLVVGGDFNTVLDPSIDRRSLSGYVEYPTLRKNLDDFISFFNLRDPWSYLRPTDKGFTRHQNASESRLDMFFIPEGMMDRVKCVEIEADDPMKISDHDPLILKLRVEQQIELMTPKVALHLEKYRNMVKPDRSPGKISGAEILNEIKSMSDSNPLRPDRLSLEFYRSNCCTLTEVLKIHYNRMLKEKQVPKHFTYSYSLKGQHIFKVHYLIFSKILSRRLSVFITQSFRRKKIESFNTLIIVSIKRQMQRIRWPFLLKSLENLKQTKPARPKDFSIFKSLLYEHGQDSSLICLKKGCPLTNTILNVALKQLELQIPKFQSSTRVSFQRQTLFIHTDVSMCDRINFQLEQFRKGSAIEIEIKTQTKH